MTMETDEPTRRTSIGSQRNPASEEAILTAAEQILRDGGLGAFSIEKVAKLAKAGKPTIYRWWPSKAALLLDVYHRQKNVPHPDTGSIRGDMEQFVSGLLTFWQQEAGGAIFRSVVAEAQSDPAALDALSQYYADRRRQSSQMLVRAKERGEIRADVDVELITEMLSSFAWARLLTGRLDCREEDIAKLVDAILSGIAKAQ
ncbi:TetR/AcrR family transcriptional regulator [Rhizobium sp. RU36D]|uniref:TetR/AcrR family transcriptional regulator n=1 Tax=Rhizobium sp. RU36D TaxID=1907415 RepID=UPI0009D87E6C|nr:TetR/AcrR family transcriptional regulator [Rhizobium sp. RU36D]SMD17311.1 transcriptional regulator, TetR family [Rhizobium sp. RU36D]